MADIVEEASIAVAIHDECYVRELYSHSYKSVMLNDGDKKRITEFRNQNPPRTLIGQIDTATNRV